MAPDSGHGEARRARRRRTRLLGASGEGYVQRVVDAADGTRLFVEAWHDDGATKTPLVLLDGLGCDGFAWKYLVPAFRAERPLLHPHYRGHGRSAVPRDLSTLTIRSLVDDLERVLDVAGVERAVFLGHSMGIQILLEAHRRLAPRIAGLVLLCGTYERPIDTWHGAPTRGSPPTLLNRVMRRIFPQLSGVFLEKPDIAQPMWTAVVASRVVMELAMLGELNPGLVKRADFAPYMKHLGNMDMRVFAALARDLAAHSAAEVLPTIEAPTLVVGGGKDTFAPVWISEEMHRRIAGSELCLIDAGSHATPIEQPLLLQLRLEKFLAERVEARKRRMLRK
jgi:pimeloyl-ACP methyl ester carboxylesterase